MSLGRGLGALITSTASRQKSRLAAGKGDDSSGGASGAAQKIWQVPWSEIQPNARQPRKDFNSEELSGLAESIKKHGILQPLLVVEKSDGGYELVSGERRLRAAKIAGLATVPVIVKELADQEKLEVALVENIQRADLNPVEMAFAFKRLAEEFGLTHEEIGKKVGKGRPTVSNYIRLLGLPAEIQAALVDGRIGEKQGRMLLSIAEEQERLKMFAVMINEKMDHHEADDRTQKFKIKQGTLRRDPNVVYVEDKLRTALGTRVFITNKKSGQGTITIEYYSKEELARLVKKLGVTF